MDAKRLRIGELLIEAGVLNHAQLRQALDLQKQQPRPLGVILVENRFVTEAQLIQALSRQLSIPWVSLWHVDVAPELLAIVTREEAERHHILPIYARTVRGERPALFVAMDDPTNQQALDFVREVAGMDVRPMIAAPTDLRQAIKALYSGEEEDEEEPEAPMPPPIMPRRSAPPPPPRAAPPPPAPASGSTDDAVELTEPVEDEEPEAPPMQAAPEPGPGDLEAGLAAASSPPPEAQVEPAAVEPETPTFRVVGAIEGAVVPEPPAEVTGVGPLPEPPEVTGVGPLPEPAEVTGVGPLPEPAEVTGVGPLPEPAEVTGVRPPPAPSGGTGAGPALETPEAAGRGPAPEPSGTAGARLPPQAADSGRAAVLEVPEATRLRRQRRALAFTFLDGTSIAVGGADAPGSERSDHAPLHELIATLRHYADDPNVPEPYGPRGLSLVVAALLEILSRRGWLSEAEWSETIGRLSRER
ncbi:MAG: hypothetical protein GYA57_10400 [Myxococcales bacterium]|nr:hypothetical protein [Myxococcales bacterium]